MSSTDTPGLADEATPEPTPEHGADHPDEEFTDEIGLAGKSCGWHPVAPEGEESPAPLAGIIRGSRIEPGDAARVVVEVTGGDGPNRLVDTDRERVHVVGG